MRSRISPIVQSLASVLLLASPARALSVSVVNNSVWVGRSDVDQWIGALNRQVQEQFAPAWGLSAAVVSDSSTSTGAWGCVLFDGDPSGSIGNHDVSPSGVPECQVNVPAAQFSGIPLPVALSHQILNMLADPWLDAIVLSPFNLGPTSAVAYLREVADPVGGYVYTIDGVSVSDFTLPRFWRDGIWPAHSMDYLGLVSIPLQPLGIGYMKARWITPFGGINSLTSWFPIGGSFCLSC